MSVQKITNGVVVLLDALGVSQFDLEECADFLRQRDEIMAEATNNYLLDQQCKLSKCDVTPTISATFGDTLLFAWNFDDDKAAGKPVALKFLAMWLAHFISDGIRRQVYYRGAISTGEILVDDSKNTVIGSAVVDASAWYEQADWFGVIATPSFSIGLDHFELIKACASKNNKGEAYQRYVTAHSKFGNDTLKTSMLEDAYSPALVRYCVPLKNDKKIETWAVSWPYAFLKLHGDNDKSAKFALLDAIVPMSKPWPKGVEEKYEKSLKFFDHCVTKQELA